MRKWLLYTANEPNVIERFVGKFRFKFMAKRKLKKMYKRFGSFFYKLEKE